MTQQKMHRKVFCNMPLSIAIDGPSGAGKSTVAKAVAQKIGAMYLDTGAMYRTVGLYMVRKGVSLTDAKAIEENLPGLPLEVKHENGKQAVYLGEENVSEAIRTPEISAAASAVSAVPAVRVALVEKQREIAKGISIVMDGRDIGTHVLPDAPVKVFLTASSEERARRRFEELKAKGIEQPYDEVLADIIRRDHNDSTRAASPLRKADDAVEIDSTGKDAEAVTAEIVALAEKALGEAK